MLITIKRELQPLNNEEARYLLDNMNYRHRLYNKGVEIIRKIKEENPKQNISRYDIDTLIYNMYEKNLDNYDYYCKGIRQIVSEDLSTMMKLVKKNGKKKKLTDEESSEVKWIDKYKFKKFNKWYRSFGFNTKVQLRHYGEYTSKVKELTNNSITILMNGKKNLKTYCIKESSWNNKNHSYEFNMYDIKQINFLYKNKKFYINLVCDVKFKNPYKKEDNRDNLAGIDLGETNPVMIYDGNEHVSIPFPDDKIDKIGKRIARLEQIQDRKQYGSKNYWKLQLKINRLYERQYNIRHHWRNKYSYYIANKFKTIIVDDFRVPVITKDDSSDIKGKGKHDINRVMLGRGMYLFMQTLRHQSKKYRCEYYNAFPNTTRTCSNCGHVNLPLPLSVKYLKCSNCGTKIHRDKNASINCYKQYDEYMNIYVWR